MFLKKEGEVGVFLATAITHSSDFFWVPEYNPKIKGKNNLETKGEQIFEVDVQRREVEIGEEIAELKKEKKQKIEIRKVSSKNCSAAPGTDENGLEIFSPENFEFITEYVLYYISFNSCNCAMEYFVFSTH